MIHKRASVSRTTNGIQARIISAKDTPSGAIAFMVNRFLPMGGVV